jgi:RNA polymerase sigma-70 factor (ECF subfamily)
MQFALAQPAPPGWRRAMLARHTPRLNPTLPDAMADRTPRHFAANAAGKDATLRFSQDFEAFFRQHEPRVTGFVWRMVGDEATASDLCQETFIRAWQHFAEVQAARSPVAWLLRVATNLTLNHIRAQSRGVRAALPLDDVDEPASSDPSVRFVERDFVQQILAELPPKTRAILILRDGLQLSFDEVSDLLGLSREAARMALSRARVQFRDRYLRQEAR